jgi:hypothetical protein
MQFSSKPMIIYFVTKADEIVYIGQTKMSLEKRIAKHKSEANLGRGAIFGAGIRKHGLGAFSFKKHSVFYNQRDLDSAEKHYIAKYKPRYNASPGGQNGIEWSWNKGKKETRPEVIEKIRNSAKNRLRTPRGPQDPETIEKRIGAKRKKMAQIAKPFLCHQNGKTYLLKVDAAKDLGLDVRGIVLVLCEKARLKSYRGYTFSYIDKVSAG